MGRSSPDSNIAGFKPGETKCPHELFYGDVPKWARYLQTFGEVRIVKSAASIQSKLENKGHPVSLLAIHSITMLETYIISLLSTNTVSSTLVMYNG